MTIFDGMKNDTDLLQEKLGSVARGAKAFQVLQVIFIVFGVLLGVASGLKLLQANSWGTWQAAAETASTAAGYLVIAWLAGRAADAFEAVSALIREMGEIV